MEDKSIAKRNEQMEMTLRQLPCNRNAAVVHDMMEKNLSERVLVKRRAAETYPIDRLSILFSSLEEKILSLPIKKESKMVNELTMLIEDTFRVFPY